MLLSPRKAKFQKQHSRNDPINSKPKLQAPDLGYFTINAEESGKLNGRQIEAIKLFLRRKFKRQAKIWVKLPLHSPFTKKPNETRLGKGKGNVKYWNHLVRPGKTLIEIKGCKKESALLSATKLKHKLSIKTNFKSKFSRWIL